MAAVECDAQIAPMRLLKCKRILYTDSTTSLCPYGPAIPTITSALRTAGSERGMATVRVDPKVHEKLRALSAAEQRSISQVIEEAIDRYEKDRFWTAMYAGFARLRSEPDAWDEYRTEAALWDSVSADGLEDEEPYFTVEEALDEIAATSSSR